MKWKGKIKRAIKQNDLFYKIICYFYIKFGFSNQKLQALEVRNKKYKKISKKYSKFLSHISYDSNNQYVEKNENIWLCWLQGIDNAPDVVKVCYESIKKYANGKITLITEDNFMDYIELPNYIINKWQQGIISNTHLSDIIRTELLIKYGGTWMDLTTYLMDNIPDYVYENEMFMYYFKNYDDLSILCNSWFIYAQKDNRLLKVTRDLLYEYWKRENRLKEYFLWHFFIHMAIEKYNDDWNKIQYFPDGISHMIQFNLYKKFDKNYWKEIKKISPIQKLTYKYDSNKAISGTYIDYIINSYKVNKS